MFKGIYANFSGPKYYLILEFSQVHVFHPKISQFLDSSVVAPPLTNVMEPGTKSRVLWWGRGRKFLHQNLINSLANWATTPFNKEAILDPPTNRGSPPPLLSAQTPSLTNEMVPSLRNCRAYPTSLGSGISGNPSKTPSDKILYKVLKYIYIVRNTIQSFSWNIKKVIVKWIIICNVNVYEKINIFPL